MNRSPKTLPYLALGAGVLALTFSTLFLRWSTAPGAITSYYRMSIAMLFLIPFWVKREKKRNVPMKIFWLLPLIGGLFAALDHAIMSTSVEFTRIANATLLNNMAPLWVAIFAILVWKEKMKWGFWVGLLLAFAGAATVLGSNIFGDPGLSKGNLMALVSSIFYAGYFLITQVARTRLTTITYIWLVDLFAAGFLMLINLGLGNSFWTLPGINLGGVHCRRVVFPGGRIFLDRVRAGTSSRIRCLTHPSPSACYHGNACHPALWRNTQYWPDRWWVGCPGGNLPVEYLADENRMKPTE